MSLSTISSVHLFAYISKIFALVYIIKNVSFVIFFFLTDWPIRLKTEMIKSLHKHEREIYLICLIK